MTFAEKWAVAHGLWKMARDARVQALRRMHPDISDQECCKLVAREVVDIQITHEEIPSLLAASKSLLKFNL
jgi:hypothetical protein